MKTKHKVKRINFRYIFFLICLVSPLDHVIQTYANKMYTEMMNNVLCITWKIPSFIKVTKKNEKC